MENAYSYSALNGVDVQVRGMVYAETEDIAYKKLKKAGFRPQKLQLNLPGTLSGLISSEFNLRELAMFYDTIGKRILSGRPLGEGLESAASFVLDSRLRQASFLTAQSVSDGTPMSAAMKTAGFPVRDAMKVMFGMPLIMMTAMYAGIYASSLFLIPKIQGFVKNLGPVAERAMDSPLQQGMFTLSRWVQSSVPVSLFLWCLPPVLLFMAFKKGYIAKVADFLPVWREISEKSDMAGTWTTFGMLYEAGVTPFEAAKTVRPSANREGTKVMFNRLEKSFYAGHSIGESSRRSDFPPYIITSMKAAESSGFPLPDEIRGMCERLHQDVDILTSRFQKTMELWSAIALGVMIIAFFASTIGPLMRFGFQSV
ncbi:MAG: type II secretion system F family protein [Methylobacter sp.]|nr:type II secretion system F family protein [Methylobacter sp.]